MSILPISMSFDLVILLTNEINSIGVIPCLRPTLTDNISKDLELLLLSKSLDLLSLIFLISSLFL